MLLLAGQALLWSTSGCAGEPLGDAALVDSVAAGFFWHDVGPTADNHEHGRDPNAELWFNPPAWEGWQAIGSPFLHIGLTPNFYGNTTELYGGVTYDLSLTHGFFFAPAVGITIHNGPLHKEKVGCEEDSDCGYGHRLLPRAAFDLGFKIGEHHAVSFFYDHVSHKRLLPGENEGLDHVGVRYRFAF